MSNRIKTGRYSGRHIIMMVLLLFCCLPLRAQISGTHDDPRINQFMVATSGAGQLQPSAYYQIRDKKYLNSATETNKALWSAGFKATLMGEISDVKSIDSALVKRAKQEALRVADRSVDIAWQSEGAKIRRRMESYENLIMKITLYGGTMDDYQAYKTDYEALNNAITAVQDAYMDNSQRTREYTKIYEDILLSELDLVQFLRKIEARKGIRKDYEDMSDTTVVYSRSRRCATLAHGRWMNSIITGSLKN